MKKKNKLVDAYVQHDVACRFVRFWIFVKVFNAIKPIAKIDSEESIEACEQACREVMDAAVERGFITPDEPPDEVLKAITLQ